MDVVSLSIELDIGGIEYKDRKNCFKVNDGGEFGLF